MPSSPMHVINTIIDGIQKNRWLAFLVFLSSLVSVPLTIYLFFAQFPSRQFYVREEAVPSTFVSRDTPGSLEVRANGAPIIGRDVFAAQISLWNGGNQSIRPDNVLAPVTLHTTGEAQILEASVVRATRPVCKALVSPAGFQAAIVSWGILEPGDGVVVQLLIVGNRNAQIGISGTIESSRPFRYTRENAKEKSDDASTSVFSIMVLLIIAAALGPGLLYRVLRDWRKEYGKKKLFCLVLSVVVTAAMLVLMGLRLLMWRFMGSLPDGLLASSHHVA